MTALVTASGLAISGRFEATDLELHAGQLCCLIGPNGSGKTSLLHALAGIGNASGTVRIGGVDPRQVGPAKRNRLLTYLPASRELAWPLVVSDLVRLGGDATDADVEAVLDALALGALKDRRTDRLSTGERSRVLIARALAPRPRLLLLDEPVSNLDPLWQLKLLQLIREEARSNGQAVLLAIHDLDLAARYADRLIVMSDRRVVSDGPVDAVLGSGVIPRVFHVERAGGRWCISAPPQCTLPP